MSKPFISIYDTTLRDGTQGEGISFSAEDKLIIAHMLNDFGIDYIEGGWPGSNPRDMDFFNLLKNERFSHSQIAAFGSTARVDVRIEDDPQLKMLLNAETEVITIFGKTWDLHVTEVLRTTLERNLEIIEQSVAYLKLHDRQLIYDAEHFFDGYKKSPAYAMGTLRAAINGGADWIVLCDTNGGTQLKEFARIVDIVSTEFPKTKVGVHCHNDCGLGVALSLIGIETGATMVQGTINGFGERVGNANLTTIIPNLSAKMGHPLTCSDNLHHLKEFSQDIDRLANQTSDNSAPFVGNSAFAHKGGVHANAAKKVARSYEHMRPELIGNTQRILLSDMSGSSSVSMKAREMGIDLKEKSKGMREFLAKIKELENRGYTFEQADASFKVQLFQHFNGFDDDFDLVSYRTISESIRENSDVNISEAVVKLRMKGSEEIAISIAESTGPVGALDHAMRMAFGEKHPEFRDVQLQDYKVRILQMDMGTDSVVQVLMKSSDGTDEWWTCGADPSIIEASWQALRDSLRYKLLQNQVSLNLANLDQ